MTQIEAVMSRIPTLTDAEIATLNATSLPIPEIVEADNEVGTEASLVMAQVPDEVDAGVYAVARVAVLGILAKNDTLIRVWTDVVGPFEIEESEVEQSPEAVAEAPHAPTEEELADLGAPVEDAPAEVPAADEVAETAKEEVASEPVDAPLDIQEGEITL